MAKLQIGIKGKLTGAPFRFTLVDLPVHDDVEHAARRLQQALDEQDAALANDDPNEGEYANMLPIPGTIHSMSVRVFFRVV